MPRKPTDNDDANSPECKTFRAAVDVLSRPWTGRILSALLERPMRFSELTERVPGIGDKILAARLRDLELHGLVIRHVDGGPPVRVSYAAGPRAQGFGDVNRALRSWGSQLLTGAPTPSKARPGSR